MRTPHVKDTQRLRAGLRTRGRGATRCRVRTATSELYWMDGRGLVKLAKLMMRHRFTVHEYYCMAEAGTLLPEARVELIEGVVIDMAPRDRRYLACIARLNRGLILGIAERGIVRVHGPLRLYDYSEP